MESDEPKHPLEVKLPRDGKRWLAWMRRYRHRLAALVMALMLALFWMALPFGLRNLLLRGLFEQAFLSGLLLVFGGLALSLLWSGGQRLDQWVFGHINMGPRPRWLDWLMLTLTQMGSGTAALMLALALYVRSERIFAYEIILGTLSLWLLVETIKATIRRPRPYILEGMRIVGTRMPGRSFPSGHTTQIFFFVTLLAQHYHFAWWADLLLYGIAVGVGLTRMYVGAHYPRDVIAGAVLGTVWGLLGGIADTHYMN